MLYTPPHLEAHAATPGQQRQRLDGAVATAGGPLARHTDGLGALDQRHLLLLALLQGNDSDSRSCAASWSQRGNGEGDRRAISSSSPRSQPSTDKDQRLLAEIHDFVAEKLSYFRTVLTKNMSRRSPKVPAGGRAPDEDRSQHLDLSAGKHVYSDKTFVRSSGESSRNRDGDDAGSVQEVILDVSPKTERLGVAQSRPKRDREVRAKNTNEEYETDDDYFVIPVKVFDVRFEPEGDERDSLERRAPEGRETIPASSKPESSAPKGRKTIPASLKPESSAPKGRETIPASSKPESSAPKGWETIPASSKPESRAPKGRETIPTLSKPESSASKGRETIPTLSKPESSAPKGWETIPASPKPESSAPKGWETIPASPQPESSAPDAAAAAFPPLPVFDTQEGFLQAALCENMVAVDFGMSSPDHDGSDTDNSCDYSPELKRNYLTAPMQMFEDRSEDVIIICSDTAEEEPYAKSKRTEEHGLSSENLVNTKANEESASNKLKKSRLSSKASRRRGAQRARVMILDSDTEDEENCIIISSDSEASEKNGRPDRTEENSGKGKEPEPEKLRESGPPPAESSPPRSKLHGAQREDLDTSTTEDEERIKTAKRKKKRERVLFSSDSETPGRTKANAKKRREKKPREIQESRLTSAESSEPCGAASLPRVGSEPQTTGELGRPNTKRRSKGSAVSRGSGKAVKKRPRVSSGTEHSSDDLLSANGKTAAGLCETADARKRQKKGTSSKVSPGLQEAESTSGSSPVIRHVVAAKSSRPDASTRLSKETPGTSTVSGKKTSPERQKSKMLLRMFPLKPVKPSHHQATKPSILKPPKVSRSLSLPSQSQAGPSSSSSSSETRLSPAPSSVPERRSSPSKRQRPHSQEGPSTLNATYGAESSALTRIRQEWKDTFVPARRDRKTSPEDPRTSSETCREPRPGPGPRDRTPRPRPNSLDGATPLMKKTKNDAKRMTKATKRDAANDKRSSVGDGYKWSEKPTKGSRRR